MVISLNQSLSGEQRRANDRSNNRNKSYLDGELLNIIASQVKLTPYTIVMSMGVVAYMMYQHLPDRPELGGGWLALVVLSQAWRIYRLP